MVAVKMLRSGAGTSDQVCFMFGIRVAALTIVQHEFKLEAEVMLELDHDNICQVLSVLALHVRAQTCSGCGCLHDTATLVVGSRVHAIW